MKFVSFRLICDECGKEASLDIELDVWADPVEYDLKALCNCGNTETL